MSEEEKQDAPKKPTRKTSQRKKAKDQAPGGLVRTGRYNRPVSKPLSGPEHSIKV